MNVTDIFFINLQLQTSSMQICVTHKWYLYHLPDEIIFSILYIFLTKGCGHSFQQFLPKCVLSSHSLYCLSLAVITGGKKEYFCVLIPYSIFGIEKICIIYTCTQIFLCNIIPKLCQRDLSCLILKLYVLHYNSRMTTANTFFAQMV